MKGETSGTQPYGNQIETGALPSDIEVPVDQGLTEWPRFDTIQFGDMTAKEAGEWIILFKQLEQAAGFRLVLVETAEGENAEQRKQLRVQRKLWGHYQEHYKGMGNAMSRRLTAIVNEMQAFSLRRM